MTATESRPVEHHPAIVEQELHRAANAQLRVADGITSFAGSMRFVYIHAVIFGVWCATGLFGADKFPFSFLTMAVSLEAIFLSCFVLISQNRQAEKDHVRSDVEYEVNIKAELEVAHLHEKTDQIYADMLEHLARIEKMLAQPR